ncbi:MAG TPA: choice-of-anchor D domain-containing protein, partial [Candidatus Acidoferrum sp.]|nr:choice-of-anchor D domain-containing protein [Candidatus Acidoferrum sp.]
MQIRETGLTRSRSDYTRLYSKCVAISISSFVVIFATIGLSGCAGYTTANTQSTGSKTLSATPTSISFGSVSVGASSTQSVILKSGGTASVTISQTTLSGSVFSITQGTPLSSIAAGQSATLQVRFAPSSSGNVTGSLTVTSDANDSPTTISLSGSGAAGTSQLTATPNSLSFGNVNVGGSSSLGLTLTNNGNSNVTISSVSASGTGYSANGVSANTTLTPGQTATVNVTFAPTAAGSASGSISVASNASNSSATISLTGNGVTQSTNVPGAPACGISGDNSNHIPTDWNTFTPPAKGQSYVDPTFGCTVTRITDASKDAWSGSFYLPLSHGYSTVSPFNANDTYLLLSDGWGRRYVTDLKGNIIVPIGNMPTGTNDGWYLWDA